ncbi:MAG: hypothetical protein KKB50_08460 [Planctomycetes bacterium]|nr:hypothetical protein [Planctomycetota bacterium]
MFISLLVTAAAAQVSAETPQRDWPHWRGPALTGVAPQADPPVEWSESRNIRWKVALPGYGHATPIVWGDRIYIQTALKTDRQVETPPADKRPQRTGRNWMGSETPTHVHKFALLALDRGTGKTVWERSLCGRYCRALTPRAAEPTTPSSGSKGCAEFMPPRSVPRDGSTWSGAME